jgi:hypothetical protein
MTQSACLSLSVLLLVSVFSGCINPQQIGGVYTSSTGAVSLGPDYYALSANSHRYGRVYSTGSWTRTGDTIRLLGKFNASNLHHLEVDRKMDRLNKWFTDAMLNSRVMVEQPETDDPTIVVDALVNDTIRLRLPRSGILHGHNYVMLSDSPQIVQTRWETIQFRIYRVKPDLTHPVDTLYSDKLALGLNPHGYVIGNFILSFGASDFDRCELKDSYILVRDGKLKWRNDVFRWHLISNLM